MFNVLIGIVLLVVLFCIITYLAYRNSETEDLYVVLVIVDIVIFVILIAYCVFCYHWIISGYKAQIMNREYGTNYTQAEILCGSDVIEEIKQLDRKRIELNGDLFKKGLKK